MGKTILLAFLFHINEHILSQILKQQKVGIAVHDELIDHISEGDKINLDKLLDAYITWDAEDSPTEFNYFTEPRNW